MCSSKTHLDIGLDPRGLSRGLLGAVRLRAGVPRNTRLVETAKSPDDSFRMTRYEALHGVPLSAVLISAKIQNIAA